MKRVYEEMAITVIFKSGTTASFEDCLDIYIERNNYYILFPHEDHILVANYPIDEVAMVVNGSVEKLEME